MHFLLQENQYEVKTRWGWFRLDERAYRDYLAGKLWIGWGSGPAGKAGEAAPLPPLPVPVGEEALSLRELAGKKGVYPLLQERFPGCSVPIPYRKGMSEISIEEMNLSVRSSNGLHRAGAHSFGGLWALLAAENGLRSVRNLGAKSETEIRRSFLAACYARLSAAEKGRFWQQLLQSREMKHD